MKKFFTAVIAIVIIAMAAYGIAYIVIPVNSAELSHYTHNVSFDCENAYIVRDETVYFSATEGIVYNAVSDGDRVAQDSVVCTIYSGNINTDTLKKLHSIDLKINRLKEAGHTSDLYKTDSDSSENQIADKMNTVFEYSGTNDIPQIADIKEDINSLRKNSSISDTARIEVLKTQRNDIEKTIASDASDIASDRAGIFSSYIDGLETVLLPENYKNFTPSYIRSLDPGSNEYLNGKRVDSKTPVCKVMNNHIWYIAGITSNERGKQLSENPDITVRFTNLTETDVSGTVIYVSEPDKDGDCVFMVKVGTYLESAFSYRTVDAQIIFEEHSGYKVPTDAIHAGEGISDYFVYARKGSESYRCDIDILYSDTDEGYSIIDSTKDAENNLGSMDRLIVGER